MPQLIIEECTRGGAHLAWHRAERFPLRIGRALDNDIVLADPYVSPLHAIVDEDEDGWIVADQESENGTFAGRSVRLAAPRHIDSGDQFTMGKTVLRFYSPRHPVAPTAPTPSPRSIAIRLLLPIGAILSFLCADAMILWQQHLESAKQNSLLSLIAESLPYLILPPAWAGLWSIAGFIVRRSTRLGWQLLVGSWALILFLALSLTADYLDYLSGSMELADTVQYAGMAVIATVLLYTNLSLAGGMGDLRRIIAAVIVGGGIVAAVAVSDHAESMENRLAPNYSHTLKPPFLKPSRADTIEQFIEESGKIFKE